MLQQLHLNKRKKQVLKSKVHLDYLNKLHDNFVLLSIPVEFAPGSNHSRCAYVTTT